MNELRGAGRGLPFSQTATGTSSAVATQTATASQMGYITGITGSSDLAGATIIVASGGTTIWQDRVSNTVPYVKNFVMPLAALKVGDSLTVTVTGTSLSNANMEGYLLPTL